MWPDLLDVLREPGTEAPLELRDAEIHGERIVSGRLLSVVSGKQYTIAAGIPRFVPDEGYTGSFGLQWNTFSTTQSDDTTGTGYSAERFDEEVGWSADQLSSGWSLEGGCGAGRFVEVVAARGGRVIAVDFSRAVDVVAARFWHDRNVHPVQADLLMPPFASRSIHRVYSIGVLQHTLEPYVGLLSLLRLCRPGGSFAFTAYGRRWYTPFYSKYLVRPVTRRLPPSLLLRMVRAVMPALFPLSEAMFKRPVLGRVARFAIPVANYPNKVALNREQRYEEAILDTFDMLAPRYDRPLRPDLVRDLLSRLPLAELNVMSDIPVVVRGRVA